MSFFGEIMNIIVCLDDKFGMLFNKRRQSRDKKIIEDILNTIKEDIYINSFSKDLFEEYLELPNIHVVDGISPNNESYYFIEDINLKDYEEDINNIIIYKWNRVYPKDLTFEIDLSKYTLESEEEFVGNSHEKITKQIYKRM